MNKDSIRSLLNKASAAYYRGEPFMSDAEFDALASKIGYESVGAPASQDKANHLYRMYSLDKIYEDEDEIPAIFSNAVESPKLDGAAISLLYVDGTLVSVITRGDGITGEDITEKILCWDSKNIPLNITTNGILQVTGEIVAKKEISNPRNYASGALHQKDEESFKSKDIRFIAYGLNSSNPANTYRYSMSLLANNGFDTVLDSDWTEYPQDGYVLRIDDNKKFEELGYTAKHPRGAVAVKRRDAVAIEETILLGVKWQVGTGGKVTPVALFEEVVIEDAKISRATLHNVEFIETMDLAIGDTILVTRAGGIIPKVVGKL